MTKGLVGRALAFALAACIPLLVADAIWGVGITTHDIAVRLANLHWLFHVGTLTLTTLGAFLGFRMLDGEGPAVGLAAVLGFLFGLVSIVAAPAAVVLGGALDCAFWQFVGAMFGAACASPFIKPVGPGSTPSKR